MITEKWYRGLTLDEYSEKYAETLLFERDNGVLTIRMHTNGGACNHTVENHHMMAQAWIDIGRDIENDVVIITGTDGEWHAGGELLDQPVSTLPDDDTYNIMFDATIRRLEGFLNNIHVPTIAAFSTGPNGSGHIEVALACEITLCSDTAVFNDGHMVAGAMMGRPGIGLPAGDGQALALEQLIGVKRAAYLVYTGQKLDARTALEWGIVNEVLPLDLLLPRAQQIGHQIIESAPRVARRLQSQMFKRAWRQRILNDYEYHLLHELMAVWKSPHAW